MDPLHQSSLLALGFVLFVVTFIVLSIARLMLRQLTTNGRATDGYACRTTSTGRRRIVNALTMVLSGMATVFGLFFLVWILWTTFSKGLDALDLHLFTQMTPPPGQETGGTAQRLLRQPDHVHAGRADRRADRRAAGTYLAEYVNHHGSAKPSASSTTSCCRRHRSCSACSSTRWWWQPCGGFSALAGAIALAFIVLPVVVRTTDEMLRLVPAQMREAALSLGVPQWKVIMQVLYRAALPGIVTGVLLALARISGETAPLLFTAFEQPVLEHRHDRADGQRAGGDLPVRHESVTNTGNRWPGPARSSSPCSSCSSA